LGKEVTHLYTIRSLSNYVPATKVGVIELCCRPSVRPSVCLSDRHTGTLIAILCTPTRDVVTRLSQSLYTVGTTSYCRQLLLTAERSDSGHYVENGCLVLVPRAIDCYRSHCESCVLFIGADPGGTTRNSQTSERQAAGTVRHTPHHGNAADLNNCHIHSSTPTTDQQEQQHGTSIHSSFR